MMLKDQVVVITGGAGIIGSELSRAIVENNGKVIIGDYNNDNGKKLIDELGSENAAFIKCDLTKENEIDSFVERSMKIYDKVDAAIHCSYPRSEQWGAKFEDLTINDLQYNLTSQLGGAIIFSQKIINLFSKQGYGNLIHISSIQGISSPKFEHYKGTSMNSPIEYSAIKSGIISMTKYLAKYLKGKNIRVNCISPGGIVKDQPQDFLKKYKKSCLSKGMLDASDLCGAAIFLLSQNSQYINGQNIIIDDGWSL